MGFILGSCRPSFRIQTRENKGKETEKQRDSEAEKQRSRK